MTNFSRMSSVLLVVLVGLVVLIWFAKSATRIAVVPEAGTPIVPSGWAEPRLVGGNTQLDIYEVAIDGATYLVVCRANAVAVIRKENTHAEQ